jgi:hypothetical protein
MRFDLGVRSRNEVVRVDDERHGVFRPGITSSHGGVLDRAVHPLGLAVGPRVVGLGELVSDAVLSAHAIEDVKPILGGWAGALVGTVGEGDAVVGQDGVSMPGELSPFVPK